jgi:hypothetical protein
MSLRLPFHLGCPISRRFKIHLEYVAPAPRRRGPIGLLRETSIGCDRAHLTTSRGRSCARPWGDRAEIGPAVDPLDDHLPMAAEASPAPIHRAG